MKELREKLKRKADNDLQQLFEAGYKALLAVCKNTVVDVEELARMVAGGRTDSLHKKVKLRIVKGLADDLLKQYDSQQELPLKKGKGS